MKKILTLAALIMSFAVYAQNSGTIKGRLKDTAFTKSLMGATISVMGKDSSLLNYALSKSDGTFQVTGIPFGEVIVLVSFDKYDPIYRNLTVTKEQPVVDLGNLPLTLAAKDLGNVTVNVSPVQIKGDTTEFNAGSFKTKPNATTEDLLKKLPGVQVEKDGTVKAQGENVTKVLVDGKKFFGNDPKMATKNLPADVVDKVQVYDAQSDQSAFSGFDDGNREKTINIITKKDKRKGYFGKASAGAGDNERYAANLSLNRFNGNQQISLIAQANNTNQQNFSIQDILGAMGGSGMFGGGGGLTQIVNMGGGGRGMSNAGNFLNGTQSGIARTIASGINYNDAWSKNTSVSGSYFYNNMNVLNGNNKLRETFVTNDSSLFTRSNNTSRNKNENHRFNLEIEQRIDSFNSIQFRPSFSFQNNNSFSNTTSSTLKGSAKNVNDLVQQNFSEGNGYNINNNILFRHRFKKKGRSLSLNLSQTFNKNVSDRHNLNYRTNYSGTFGFTDTTDLLTDLDRDGKSYGINLSYTEPIDKKSMIEVGYNYNYSINNSNQATNRYNGALSKYVVDSVLTNNFENTNISNRVSLNYRRQVNKEWSYTLGMGVQHAELASDNQTKSKYLSQSFYNYFPTVMLQYSKNRAKNLRLNYRGSTRQPQISQLQDVIDATNPLSIKNGNPGLQQEFYHSINLMYTSFDIFTFKNFFVGINGGFTSNKIGNYIITNFSKSPFATVEDSVRLTPGAQYSKPMNINGAYNFNAFVNYGFPIKKLKANLNFTTSGAFNRDVSLLRDASQAAATKAYTRNYAITERIGFTMNLKEKFDLNFSSASTYTIAKYSNQPQLDANFFTQMFSVEPTYSSKSGWIFGLDFDYNIYTGQSDGFNQAVPLLNASITKQIFKNKAGEIRLSAFDLLKQNQSITRTVQENYVEDVNTQVLQRYFMVSFTYNLRKFGQNGMPNLFRMFRGAGGPGGREFRMN